MTFFFAFDRSFENHIHVCGSMSIPLFSVEQKGSPWFGLAHWCRELTSSNKFRDSLLLLERWGTTFIIQYDCCIQQCLHTVAAFMVHHIVGLGGGGGREERRGEERRGEERRGEERRGEGEERRGEGEGRRGKEREGGTEREGEGGRRGRRMKIQGGLVGGEVKTKFMCQVGNYSYEGGG